VARSEADLECPARPGPNVGDLPRAGHGGECCPEVAIRRAVVARLAEGDRWRRFQSVMRQRKCGSHWSSCWLLL
jgi:hypothetical protein